MKPKIFTSLAEVRQISNTNIYSFLTEQDDFYEGTYLNRIKYIPKKENGFYLFPLWLINGGYLWEVRKQFPKGARILELGCASGIDYFGKRFEMIGLDLSLTSLKGIKNYKYKIHADATQLPIVDNCLDGIISSYFWEHIPPKIKREMLKEFKRVLKPRGKIVFLYDVATDNKLISLLKDRDLSVYNQLFLEKDGHLGYETPKQNKVRFENFGFKVLKHFGMERSIFQSRSVYVKFAKLSGLLKVIGSFGLFLTKSSLGNKINMLWIRIWDATFGCILKNSKARIIITVAQKDNIQ